MSPGLLDPLCESGIDRIPELGMRRSQALQPVEQDLAGLGRAEMTEVRPPEEQIAESRVGVRLETPQPGGHTPPLEDPIEVQCGRRAHLRSPSVPRA